MLKDIYKALRGGPRGNKKLNGNLENANMGFHNLVMSEQNVTDKGGIIWALAVTVCTWFLSCIFSEYLRPLSMAALLIVIF